MVEYLSMFVDDSNAPYSCSYKLFQTYKSPREPNPVRPSKMPELKTSPRPKRHRPRSKSPRVKVGAVAELWPHAGQPLVRTSPSALPAVNMARRSVTVPEF